MPRIRHEASLKVAVRNRDAVSLGRSRNYSSLGDGRPCLGSEHCAQEPIDACPVRLCGKHLHEVYSFASDMVTDGWDGAVRDYVSGLHATFKPPRAVKQPRAGWVYFIRFGDRVKVGYSTDPDNRLKVLPHEQVIGIVPGTRADEAAWHKLLNDYHVVGEWFRAEPELLATLARVAAERTA